MWKITYGKLHIFSPPPLANMALATAAQNSQVSQATSKWGRDPRVVRLPQSGAGASGVNPPGGDRVFQLVMEEIHGFYHGFNECMNDDVFFFILNG